MTLTSAQRAAVEWADGPLMVLAGAGTGKTTVVVERVRHLLATDPTLQPENILVLTYNVRAAGELVERLERTLGIEKAGRLNVHNFHSFGYRLLRDHRAELGLAATADLLDQVGQRLLLRSLRPQLKDFLYHKVARFPNAVDRFADVISRAKDELVTPADFEAFVANEHRAFEDRYGNYADAAARLVTQGNLKGPRDVRADYAKLRHSERAEERGEEVSFNPQVVGKTADREARRAVGGTGAATPRSRFSAEQQAQIDELADTYVKDGAALEVMRLTEIAVVYRAYQEELVKRGALDFGEQIAATTQLFKVRPNLLRRWQRQFSYILVDEFQELKWARLRSISGMAAPKATSSATRAPASSLSCASEPA